MKSSILIFGGSVLQASIIKQASSMGFRTILIDPDKQAFAKNLSDVFIRVSGDDYENTLKIAEKYNIKGLVTVATDNPLPMMSRIAEKLKLPFPSEKSISIVLDKWEFKNVLRKNNIPYAKGLLFQQKIDIEMVKKLRFPLIVKPIKGSGSKGVFKCDNTNELLLFSEEAFTFSKENRILVEEYIEGDEISAEALVVKKKLMIIQITDKIVSAPPYNVEMGHIQPSQYLERIDEIETMLQNVIDITGLDNCAIHPELKINSNGVFLIELGPRLGGDYITSHLVPLSTGVNMEEQIIRLATKQNPQIKYYSKASFIKYLNREEAFSLKRISNNIDLYTRYPYLVTYEIDENIDSKPETIKNSFDRAGYYIIAGKNRKEIEHKQKSFIQLLSKS